MKDQDNVKPEDDQEVESIVTDEDEAAAVEASDESELSSDEPEASEAMLAELNKYKELSLRIQAEADNQHKRMQREFEKRRQFALESFMRDLIGVRDSLERGLDASQLDTEGTVAEQVTAVREGMQMTLKQLDKVLTDNGLSVVDPLGEVFDPEQQQAISMQPSDDQPANSVLQVIQKGYCLHERLLRPAMVIVAKAPE